MASTTKYSPAPQEDPEAHLEYTQAPPSYQAESSAANDQERLFGGAPRNSEDNVPDDFKVSFSLACVVSRITNTPCPVRRFSC